MTRTAISVKELIDTTKGLLAQGYHPSQIRRTFQARGIHWPYSGRHQGTAEMARRRAKLRLCDAGCGQARFGSSNLCVGCLEKQFGDMQP